MIKVLCTGSVIFNINLITSGSSELVGSRPTDLQPYFDKILRNEWKHATPPALWDGKAAERIVDVLVELYVD